MRTSISPARYGSDLDVLKGEEERSEKCYDCAASDEVVDAVAICHHCGVGVCLRHCHVAREPGHRLAGVGQSTLGGVFK
ncbi:DUF2180 family protein [Streptomyces sp. NPDC048196]|uniref:DUF2180 family protein n=1 Tax=Streptomyces sp. NPDC048196 TaxID=3154712 RepID=UPI0033F4928F